MTSKRRRHAALAALCGLILVGAPEALAGRGAGFGDTGYRLLHGRWAAVTPFYGAGPSQLGEPREGLDPTAVGVRYVERKGHITGVIFALINSVATGLAANSPKSVRTYRSGNYIITETTYRSAAERQAMIDAGAEVSADMLEAEDQSFELEIYSKALPGGGEASGYKMNMYFGATLADELVLDIGLGWGSVVSRLERDGRQAKLDFSYFGLPVKLNWAVGPVVLWFQWDWNWLGEWSGHAPRVRDEETAFSEVLTRSHLELGLTTVLFERIMLQAGVTTPKIDALDFGYRVSAGLRF